MLLQKSVYSAEAGFLSGAPGVNVPFQGLLEAEKNCSVYRFEALQAVVWDPPYSSHWTAKLSNSVPDQPSLKDMSRYTQWLLIVVDSRVHGHLLGTALQFKTWERLKVGIVEDFKYRSLLGFRNLIFVVALIHWSQ